MANVGILTRWIPIRCDGTYRGRPCRRMNLHAAPGSKVRFVCQKCGKQQVAEV